MMHMQQWRLLSGGRFTAMAGMESMETTFGTIPFTPFQPPLWVVRPSAASTGVHKLEIIRIPVYWYVCLWHQYLKNAYLQMYQ